MHLSTWLDDITFVHSVPLTLLCAEIRILTMMAVSSFRLHKMLFQQARIAKFVDTLIALVMTSSVFIITSQTYNTRIFFQGDNKWGNLVFLKHTILKLRNISNNNNNNNNNDNNDDDDDNHNDNNNDDDNDLFKHRHRKRLRHPNRVQGKAEAREQWEGRGESWQIFQVDSRSCSPWTFKKRNCLPY